MCNKVKRPYEKPSMTVIPEGTERYEELMQLLSQENDKEATVQSSLPASGVKKEECHV